MLEADINELLRLIDDTRNYLNGNSGQARNGDSTQDYCIAGQWNTFQYVARNQETQTWAEVKQLRKPVDRLQEIANRLESQIENTNSFLNYLEELANGYANHKGSEIE